MIKKKIDELRKKFNFFGIDGYIVPKNDEFFSEYTPSNKDNLQYISNFSGSYGLALILKKNNFLFYDLSSKDCGNYGDAFLAVLISNCDSYRCSNRGDNHRAVTPSSFK